MTVSEGDTRRILADAAIKVMLDQGADVREAERSLMAFAAIAAAASAGLFAAMLSFFASIAHQGPPDTRSFVRTLGITPLGGGLLVVLMTIFSIYRVRAAGLRMLAAQELAEGILRLDAGSLSALRTVAVTTSRASRERASVPGSFVLILGIAVGVQIAGAAMMIYSLTL